jgi:probable F420-dependent oxidoreductase
MDIGIIMFVTHKSIDIITLAQKAEALGFESLWIPEHPIIPVHMETRFPGSPDGKLPEFYKQLVDPFVALGAAAAATQKLKIATGICLVPERNPILLAKEVATLDLISKGRFLFGVGAGWLKEETEIMGGDFEHRWRQTKDAVLAMKALWTQDESSYQGSYYKFPPVWCYPKPVQKPHPPVILGGEAANVFKRVIEWGDGWLPRGNYISLEKVAEGRRELDRLAMAAGRDPKSISITIYRADPDPESNARYAEVGVNRVLHLIPSLPEAEAIDALEKLAATVKPGTAR